MNKSDKNIETNDEIIDDSILQLVGAAGSLPEIEIPEGFHNEIMRAIRLEASKVGSKAQKSGLWNTITKINKRGYIFVGATAACLLLAFMFVSPLLGTKSYAPQYNEAAPAAQAPMASAPMAAAAPAAAPMATEAQDSPALYSNVDNGFSEGGFPAGELKEDAIEMEREAVLQASQEAGIVMEAVDVAGAPSNSVAKDKETAYGSSGAESRVSQKIIKTADYNLEVTDFDSTVALIQQIAESSGGYIENFSSGIYNTYYPQTGGARRDLKNGYLCLRVPQEEYSSSKIRLESLGKITSTFESTHNITSSYVDTAARLEVKKTEEQRLIELYGKADEIEDLISLETRLSYVRSDIESMMAQLQNWDRSVSFSTINISLNEVVDYSQIQSIDPSLGEKITEGFYRSIANFTYNVERLIVITAENSIAILVFIVLAVISLTVVKVIIKRSLRKRRSGDESENI